MHAHETRRSLRSELRLGQYAHRNRSSLTRSEARLWEAIRGRQLGVAFRRQVPLAGRFIVDFLAPRVKLVVEVDGGYHRLRMRADARRDEKLRRLGYRVVRLEAELVLGDLAAAVGLIREALNRARFG